MRKGGERTSQKKSENSGGKTERCRKEINKGEEESGNSKNREERKIDAVKKRKGNKVEMRVF